MSSTDTAMLAKQKELLLDRLADFESTNRALRRMLRQRHQEEADGLRLAEQRDLLLRKLSETEDGYQVLILMLNNVLLKKNFQLFNYIMW